MRIFICTNLSGNRRIKRRACKFKNFKLARSVQNKQPIKFEYFTVMMTMQYLFIVNLWPNGRCCFQWKWKYLCLILSLIEKTSPARSLTFQRMEIGHNIDVLSQPAHNVRTTLLRTHFSVMTSFQRPCNFVLNVMCQLGYVNDTCRRNACVVHKN